MQAFLKCYSTGSVLDPSFNKCAVLAIASMCNAQSVEEEFESLMMEIKGFKQDAQRVPSRETSGDGGPSAAVSDGAPAGFSVICTSGLCLALASWPVS